MHRVWRIPIIRRLAQHQNSIRSTTSFSTTSRFRQGKSPSESIPKDNPINAISKDVRDAAILLEGARRSNTQIKPLSSIPTYASLSQTRAYEIAATATALRISNGDKPIGRKIGFTNASLWPVYNIDTPIWGYVYDSTIRDVVHDNVLDIAFARGLEPKIEPEIVLRLRRRPSPDMSELQILECVEWIAHGFEVVVSVYPGWKFTAADTIATGALHGCLVVGRRYHTEGQDPEMLLRQLREFEVSLYKDGELVEKGRGSNVLESPIEALRFLSTVLEKQGLHPQLTSGEIITTGTLTSALDVAPGEHWSTKMEGINLEGLDIKFQ